jgi:hypothetical protein
MSYFDVRMVPGQRIWGPQNTNPLDDGRRSELGLPWCPRRNAWCGRTSRDARVPRSPGTPSFGNSTGSDPPVDRG